MPCTWVAPEREARAAFCMSCKSTSSLSVCTNRRRTSASSPYGSPEHISDALHSCGIYPVSCMPGARLPAFPELKSGIRVRDLSNEQHKSFKRASARDRDMARMHCRAKHEMTSTGPVHSAGLRSFSAKQYYQRKPSHSLWHVADHPLAADTEPYHSPLKHYLGISAACPGAALPSPFPRSMHSASMLVC